MNKPAGNAETPMFGAKWAFGLGAALLVGFAGVMASAIYDKVHLSSLETISEPTAVGDKAYVTLASRQLGMTVLTWKGLPLRLADLKNISASDPDMRKAGIDDSDAFFIYTSPKGETYVKARDTEYLKVER
jgi:hypothetical protein